LLATFSETYLPSSQFGSVISPLPTTNLVMWAYGKYTGPATSARGAVATPTMRARRCANS
jgi:hypothetical protein